MAEISLEDYIATGRGKFSFVHRANFVVDDKIRVDDLCWYAFFKEHKALEFFFGEEILEMNEHQLIDLLICCRGCIGEGGVLRFDLDAGERAAAIEQRLVRLLFSLGFAVQLHISPGFAPVGPDLRPLGRAVARYQGQDRIALAAMKTPGRHVGNNGAGEQVYVVGDSHIWFLSGQTRKDAIRDKAFGGFRFENTVAFFKGYHLGPGLAYNLGKLGTTTGTTERLEYLLTSPGYIPAGARLMLVFGEIDCRGHVCRIVDEKGLSIEDVVENIVTPYRNYLITLLQNGYRPMVWGPVAPTAAEHLRNAMFPIYGEFPRRLAASRRLTARMQAVCGELGIPFISILERLLDAHGVTDRRYYEDPIHVGHGGRPFLWEVFQEKTGLRTLWSDDMPAGPTAA